MFLKKYLPAIPVVIILAMMIFSDSCANTTTPPTGGPKDTIPPVITKLSQLPGRDNDQPKKTKHDMEKNQYNKIK